jgi:hypothetical protein
MLAPEGYAMTLTLHMREMLRAVLAETRRLEAVGDRPPDGMDREEWRDLWWERRDFESFGVAHDLARWLGHAPTTSESAVFSRALWNMEDMGLLARVSRWGGRRTTHVRLSTEGRTAAERLLVEDRQAETPDLPIEWSQVELPLIELPPDAVEPGGEGRNA